MAIGGKDEKPSATTEQLFEIIRNMSEDDRRTLLRDLELWAFSGRRKHPRVPVVTVVDYATRNGAYKDFIRNISAGGVFIETRMPFSVGEEVALTFTLPKQEKHIKIKGKIVRSTDRGIGVRFLMAGEEEEEMLESFLAQV